LTNQEDALREQIVLHGRSLFARGFSPGSSGNISVKLDNGILVTPTHSCLGRLEPGRISRVDWEGHHQSGDKPSKEAFLHLLMLKERPQDGAVVHLHSTHSVAVSCLEDRDPQNVLPPITPYYVMRIGRLPRVPYYRPGDPSLAQAVARLAREHHAVLLAHHGPVVSGPDLDTAVAGIEELEETAKLFLLLKGQKTRYLTEEQVAAIERDFPR
jgi:ribulose-5-phosphate 4-epimerase/fuculose-1-phosphate aldolase